MCLAIVATSVGWIDSGRFAALMIPGTWVAIRLRTPDIHGGSRFIWTALGATFLIYFVVFWSLLALMKNIHAMASKNSKPIE